MLRSSDIGHACTTFKKQEICTHRQSSYHERCFTAIWMILSRQGNKYRHAHEPINRVAEVCSNVWHAGMDSFPEDIDEQNSGMYKTHKFSRISTSYTVQ